VEEPPTGVTAEDLPVGPSAAEEAAFLAQEREMSVATPPLTHEERLPQEKPGELPPMDDLVQRIPAPVRETLEELFRARFITVKRIPQSAIK
jgi:hypothetical protein